MKKVKIYSVISSIIFLLSGIGKALSVSDFSDLIIRYGFAPFHFLAPAIVIAEILVGLLLLFQIWQKKVSFLSLVAVFIFTIVYLYGYLQHDIKDCGCFGSISFLTLPPLGIFIRNAILLYLLFDVWRNSKDKVKTKAWQMVTILIVMIGMSFVAGYTSQNNLNFGKKDTKYQGKILQDTPLNEFVTLSNDSTYLIFVFSYSCSHCLNSIENLKQYEKSGVVDKVIGLAWGDSVNEDNLNENFNPNFLITTYDPMSLFKITNRFPTAYYIRNNKIEWVIHGELPCAYILNKQMKKQIK